ncbi:MAG: outer membrane beta-barrel protein [Gammaproteobacteria bacterium]|nr:outer membrane beta-barrel protein [Gammaproteobacteria bacterium]
MSTKTKLFSLAAISCLFVGQAQAVDTGLYIGVAVGATKAEGHQKTIYTSPLELPLLINSSAVVTNSNGVTLPAGSYAFSSMYQVLVPVPHTGGSKALVPVTPPAFNVNASGVATTPNGTPFYPAGQYQVFNATSVRPNSSTGVGERLFMGFRINPYSAFEFGYTHYAAVTYKVPAGTQVPLNNPGMRSNTLDMEGVFIYPVSKIAVFAKLGLAAVRVSNSGSLQPPIKQGNGGTTVTVRPLVGVGVSLDVTQQWVVDFTYTIIPGGSSNTIKNASFGGIGVSYHFTDKLCGQFLC